MQNDQIEPIDDHNYRYYRCAHRNVSSVYLQALNAVMSSTLIEIKFKFNAISNINVTSIQLL